MRLAQGTSLSIIIIIMPPNNHHKRDQGRRHALHVHTSSAQQQFKDVAHNMAACATVPIPKIKNAWLLQCKSKARRTKTTLRCTRYFQPRNIFTNARANSTGYSCAALVLN
jgi:hypothetical protein